MSETELSHAFDRIIDALETASGPDDKLDQEIARLCKIEWSSDEDGNFGGYGITPKRIRFTSSVDAAMTLIPRGHGWVLDFMDPYEPDAAVGAHVCSRDHGDPEPKNPALMLCVAAMKARATLST